MPLNKQQLLVLNNTNFPNNNVQYISPALLREFNSEMVAALQLTQSMSEYPVLVGNNYFIGNNVMQGDLRVTGTISASVIHTIYETASVIYSTGSNQLGDQLTDVQTLSGSVLVQGGLFVNGVAVPTSAITASSLITASVINGNEIQFTKGDASVFSILIDTGSAVDIAQLNAFTASQQIINSNVSQSIAGLNSKTGSYATTGSNTFTGNQIISKENVLYTNGIYWNDSTPGYNNIEIINSATGNLDLSALSGKVRVVNTSLVLTGSALTSSNDISTSANIYAANLTGSVIDSGSLVTTASFNAYTQSTNNRLNNLESTTASINTSITNINSFTQSANQRLTAIETVSGSWITESESGSFLITASFASQTLTFTKGDGSTFGIVIPDVSGSTIDTGSFATTASFNDYTQSTNSSISQLNASSASQQISINNLNTSASLSVITASFDNGTRNLTFTKGDASTFAVNIPDVSGSTLNTGSFATTGSNVFTGNQTIAANGGVLNLIDPSNPSYGTSSFGISGTSGGLIFRQSGSIVMEGSLSPFGLTFYSTASFNRGIKISDSDVTAGGQILYDTTNTKFIMTHDGAAEADLDLEGTFTASLQQGYVWVGDQSGRTMTVATSSFGGGGSINTGSLLVTASFNAGTITFTKGDGSTFPLNSFASLGANQFTGSQEILNNSQLIFGNGFSLRGNATDIAQISAQTSIQFITEGAPGPGGTNDIRFINRVSGSQIEFRNDQAGAGNGITFGGGEILFNVVAVSGSSQKVRFGNSLSNSPVSIDASNSTFTASLQQGYAWVGNSMGISTAVATSSFAGGSVPAGTISGSEQITALGFVSSSITGSSLITASVNLNTITFTKGDNTTFALTVNTGSGGGGTTYNNPTLNPYSGSLILAANLTSTASLAPYITASNNGQVNLMFLNRNLTGGVYVSGSSNIFPNPNAPAAGRLNYLGGSSNILLTSFTANNSQTFPSMTASAATIGGVYPALNGNIMMGQSGWTINPSNNPGIHNYNNNILSFASAQFNTTGLVQTAVANSGRFDFQQNLGLGSNFIINAPSRSVAELNAGATGSMRLQMNNNILYGGTLTYNGPVSASTTQIHNIGNNAIAGIATLNLQSGSKAYTITNNNINGNFTYTDNIAFTPTLGSSALVSNNVINGVIGVTVRNSGSVQITNNNLGGWQISQNGDMSGITGAIQRRADLGANFLGGVLNNNLQFSGSATGAQPKLVSANILFGTGISASVGGGEEALLATAVVGAGLQVFGTSIYNASNVTDLGANQGSAFFGRWNSLDVNKARTAETIFAVGTGNSGSAGIVRKTGFLIDSGSNTFVEGTLNVSGSSTLSGSLYIQSGSTLPVSTGSAILTWDATTGQVKQASFSTIVSASVSSAEFWSTTTQSGSAGVSGSIQFNNSGSFYNISLVNGTQLTVGNAGVYNIQFSAQVETSAGADTVYIWFKKNGTNIGDSASKAVLANNTAQVITVNILDQAVANDYYEIAYQNINGHATVLAEAASGNIPAIPSVIATIIQVR